jgi:hypothetical protein
MKVNDAKGAVNENPNDSGRRGFSDSLDGILGRLQNQGGRQHLCEVSREFRLRVARRPTAATPNAITSTPPMSR